MTQVSNDSKETHINSCRETMSRDGAALYDKPLFECQEFRNKLYRELKARSKPEIRWG